MTRHARWAIAALLIAPLVAGADESPSLFSLVQHGAELKAAEARKLEQQLPSAKDPLTLHAWLVGYDGQQRAASKKAQRAWTDHVGWLIQHQPDLDYSFLWVGTYGALHSGEVCGAVSPLWERAVKTHPTDVKAIVNAAIFARVGCGNAKRTAYLYDEAMRLQPDEPRWAMEAGAAYERQIPRSGLTDIDDDPQALQKAIEHYEAAWKRTQDPLLQVLVLGHLSSAYFSAARGTEAKHSAEELLTHAALIKDNAPAWSDAIYTGHEILGRIAWRVGDLAGAKAHLLESGHLSHPLAEPDMALARELVEKGERDTVLAFLNDHERWWLSGGGPFDPIESWKVSVKAGKVPEDWTGHGL